jgi:hypothetical protein
MPKLGSSLGSLACLWSQEAIGDLALGCRGPNSPYQGHFVHVSNRKKKPWIVNPLAEALERGGLRHAQPCCALIAFSAWSMAIIRSARRRRRGAAVVEIVFGRKLRSQSGTGAVKCEVTALESSSLSGRRRCDTRQQYRVVESVAISTMVNEATLAPARPRRS